MPVRGRIYQDGGFSTHLNIDFGAAGGLKAMFRGLDEQLIQTSIAAKDQLWPGKGLTQEQVRDNYTSPLKERPEYSTTLRCKIDTEKCRCYSWEGSKF